MNNLTDTGEHWQDKCERYISGLKRTTSGANEVQTRGPEYNTGDHVITAKHGADIYPVEMNRCEDSKTLAPFMSLHGLPFAVKSRNWCAKATWIITIMSGCGSLAILCYLFTMQYLQQGHVAMVSLDTNPSTSRFPAVTVCNVNILRKSRLPGTVFENLTVLDEKAANFHLGFPNSGEQTPVPEENDIHEQLRNFTQKLEISNFNELISELDRKYQKLTRVEKDTDWFGLYRLSASTGFQQLKDAIHPSKEHYQSLGHNPRDTILTGHIHGDLLEQSDLKETLHQKYGRCVTVVKEKRSTIEAEGRLALTLNLEAEEYIGFLYPSVSAFVFIHDPGEPLSESSRQSVAAGEWMNLDVRLKEINRPMPCRRDRAYAVQSCRLSCLHEHQQSLCGCNQSFEEKTVNVCSLTDRKHFICVGLLEHFHKLNKLPCDCADKCQENEYKLSHSKAQWPSQTYMPHLKAQLEYLDYVWNDQRIRQNLAHVTISFDGMYTERIRVVPETSLLDLLVKMGGISSLLCGVSLITVLEVLWVIFVAVFTCCPKQPRRQRLDRYEKHVTQETSNSQDQTKTQVDGWDSHLVQRKDSRSIRKLAAKKRLGGNRRPPNHGASRFQHWKDLRPPVPLHTSTFRYRRNNNNISPAESGEASCNRLVTNNGSSEESRENPGYLTDSTAPQSGRIPTQAEPIVPRLNLDDLLSNSETEYTHGAWEGLVQNGWQGTDLRHLNHISTVDNPNQITMANMFREIQRLRSNAGDRRKPVFQQTRNGRYLCETHSRY